MNIYFIRPVRKLEELAKKSEYWRKVAQRIKDDVRRLEQNGHIVRDPIRDTVQTDEIGLHIVEDHEDDIKWAPLVRVYWYPGVSEGSVFDIMQTFTAKEFMSEKEIEWVNRNKPAYIEEYRGYINEIISVNPFVFEWTDSQKPLVKLAIARMVKQFQPETRIVISNFGELEITPTKSYTNVAIATHLGLTSDTTKTRQDLLDAIETARGQADHGIIK